MTDQPLDPQPLDQIEWDELNRKLRTLPDGEERAAALAEYRHRDGISRNSFSRAMQWMAYAVAIPAGLSALTDEGTFFIGAFAVIFAICAGAAFWEAWRARHPAKYKTSRTEPTAAVNLVGSNGPDAVSSAQAPELTAGPGSAAPGMHAAREQIVTRQKETPQ